METNKRQIVTSNTCYKSSKTANIDLKTQGNSYLKSTNNLEKNKEEDITTKKTTTTVISTTKNHKVESKIFL
jgi:hypothetical protein